MVGNSKWTEEDRHCKYKVCCRLRPAHYVAILPVHCKDTRLLIRGSEIDLDRSLVDKGGSQTSLRLGIGVQLAA